MRKIESDILAKLACPRKAEYNLSCRDRVVVRLDGSKSYYLWDTELFHMDSIGRCSFYFSSIAADTSTCMSATTSSRINVLMRQYTGTTLMRSKGKLYYDGEQIMTDSWYLWGYFDGKWTLREAA